MLGRARIPLVTLALIAAACSSDPAAVGEDQAAPAVPAVAAEGTDNTLRLALERPPDFDPATQRVSSPSALIAMDLLLDGLTATDGETGEVVPAIAESWRVSDSGLVWRFDLHTSDDGGPELVDAADVRWTLARIAGLGAGSIPGAALAPIEGYAAVAAGEEDAELTGIEVVRPDRVTIRLTEPFAALPKLLAHPTMGILPDGDAAVDLLPEREGPTSSAFTIVAGDDDALVLEPNERFDGDVDRVEITWVDDFAEAATSVVSGGVDLAPVTQADVSPSTTDVVAPYASTVFFGLNVQHPALADAAFRRAILQSVDRTAVAEDLYQDSVVPIAGLVPEDGRDVCGDACAHDPQVAQGMLEFVFGDDEPPTIQVDHLAGDDREEALAAAIVSSLEAIGVSAELRPGTLDELEERIASGEHQIFRFGWVAPYDDPQAWLDSLFRSVGADNVFNLADDEIDDLLDELGSAADPTERAALGEEAEQAILTSYVVIPVLAHQQVVAASDRVDNLHLRPDGTIDFAQLSLG